MRRIRTNSNIRDFKDLKNKRVYIGNKGSGSRIMADKLFLEIGWKASDFQEVHEESADKIYNLFCENKIDGAVYLVGHPNVIFTKTLKECDTRLISFSRREIERYIDLFHHITPATVKKGTYFNQNRDVQTFASQLILASSSELDEEVIYNFVRVVAENYPKLQRENPSLRGSDLFGYDANIIPSHKGVSRYYRSLD